LKGRQDGDKMIAGLAESSQNAKCKIMKANESQPALTEWQITDFRKEECTLMRNILDQNGLA
jgi:hypothetical protein